MKRFLRALAAFVALLLVLLAASPGLLYVAGLARIHDRPQPSTVPPLSVEQQNWLRCELKAGDRYQPAVTDPWRLALGFLKDDPAPNYGDRLAWLVARDRSGKAGGAGWDLSSASLAIWLARHWTLEQLEAGAHEALHQAHHFQCEPGPVEWPES